MQDAFDRYNLTGYFRSLLVLPITEIYSDGRATTEYEIATEFLPFFDETVEVTVPPLNYTVYHVISENRYNVLSWMQNTARYLKWFQEFFGVEQE